MAQERGSRKVRVLVGKPGLDGHDRGAKVVALALRDAGFEVIYTGLHQSIEAIVAAAKDGAVDVIGLSIMSGAHMPLCKRLVELVRKEGLDEVLLVVGGVIPKKEVAELEALGMHGVFPGGTPFDEFISWIRNKTMRATDELDTARGG